MASRLNWLENGATFTQETLFPYEESSRITVNMKKSRRFKLMVRCPEWTDEGFSVKVNGKEYGGTAKPSSYVTLERKWKNGDVIEISLPMRTIIEPLQNKEEYIAVKRGPIVLAARTSHENLDGLISDDSRYAIYFLSLTKDGYNTMLETIKADEAAILALDRRTIDKVTPFEQQPEADHLMQQDSLRRILGQRCNQRTTFPGDSH